MTLCEGIHRCVVDSHHIGAVMWNNLIMVLRSLSGQSFTAEDGCNTCHCEENPDGTLVAICTSMACINDNLCVANNITYSEGEGEWKFWNLLDSRIQGFKGLKKNFYSMNIHKKYSISTNWTIPTLYWRTYQSYFRYIIEGNESFTGW